ncbi:hypothetical protein ABZ820_34650 [Streptomyces diacarni]|uniref:hypothetical protein n=1 Tax=Streptomyces diacarni TaxID=2800381 RepID=UPI0033D300C8
MSGLPRFLMRHRVTVERYEGEGAYGEVYGPATVVRCFLEHGTRLVKDADGNEVTSTSTAYALPDTEPIPARSRATLPDGRQTTVIAALTRDGGGLPTPDHLEVQFQ